MASGYEALRENAAWIDLSGRGLIRASGEDRARLLHAMTTNHVQQLQAGQGCYAFFLTAQGRILADVNILALSDHLLLDTEPETADKVYRHLDHYIIADDVKLENLTDQWAAIGVEGPKAIEAVSAVGAPAPETGYSWSPWQNGLIARISATGATGFRIFTPSSDRPQLITRLESNGLPAATPDAVNIVRLENGKPRYGDDITEGHLPQETQQMHGLHFSKGCYLGQEIVERVRSRGHVNRLLKPLRIAANEAPPPGAKVVVQGKEIGEITSAAYSPALGCVVALGYIRAEHARPDVAVDVGGASGQIAA
jgi:folate-binding protein YgfZ